MQMDMELGNMKEQCDKQIKEAASATPAFTDTNTEDDEEKIGILLKVGTLHLQIKGLKKTVESQAKELSERQNFIRTAQAEKDKLAVQLIELRTHQLESPSNKKLITKSLEKELDRGQLESKLADLERQLTLKDLTIKELQDELEEKSKAEKDLEVELEKYVKSNDELCDENE